jgi:MYXO-CTERM domain-containing protein
MKKQHSMLFAALVALALPASGAVIVLDDDGDRDNAAGPNVTTVGFSTHNNGGWGVNADNFNRTTAFNNTAGDTAATATYTLDVSQGVVAGEAYFVYATWPQNGQGNLGPATYTVSDGLGAVTVDQTLAVAPDLLVTDPYDGAGKHFQYLGQITDDGDGIITITLKLGTGNSNFIMADAVALQTVPEPSSASFLLGLGLGGLALMQRRRRK